MKYLYGGLIALFVFAAPVFAKDPVLTDFAYGVRLDVKDRNALFEFSLPIEVYRGSTRNDLGDVCMFNSQGEVVPFALYKPAGETASPEMRKLPIFPLPGNRPQLNSELSLLVKTDKAGAVIDVRTDSRKTAKHNIAAYLVDATSLDYAIAAFELDWQAMMNSRPENSVSKITVEYSDDLAHWTHLLSGATIANLHYGNHSLERRTIELGNIKAKYFLLSSPAAQMIKLKAVSAKKPVRNVEQPRKWLTVFPNQQAGKPDEYSFDLAGHMPVDRLRLMLPQKNTFLKIAVLSQTYGKDAWIQRHSGTTYRIELQGEEMTSPDIEISPVADRFWLVRTDHSGGGLGKGLPQLNVGWIPHKALFAARGDAPFTLAYGSKTAVYSICRRSAELLKFKDEQKEKAVIKAVEPGPQIILGGKALLNRPALGNWRQWLLWSILLFGVILMAWMAIRLYRQMNKEGQ